MMELFVGHGAKIDLTNRYDEQALQLAAWRDTSRLVRWLSTMAPAPTGQRALARCTIRPSPTARTSPAC